MKTIKHVNIIGKKNIHGIVNTDKSEKTSIKMDNESENVKITAYIPPKRVACEKWNLPDYCFTHSYQMNAISKLYLNIEDDGIDHRLFFIKELTKKIYGYKRQDIDKRHYDKDLFISLDALVEKLLCSKLKCFYCKQVCELLYENIYSKLQWTLDRIDNNIGHNSDNVVICCLECNLKKGTMDSSRFKYGKQLTFTKLE